eukprot:c24649_g2_i1 orf=565-3339(-)
MAFANYRNGSSIPSRTPQRLDRPIPVNSTVKFSVPSPPSSASSPTRPKSLSPLQPSGKRHSTGSHRNGTDDSGVSGRVRVAVRLRPRNAEELVADADFADCVELQPELKRLKLRKNNWDCETYQFDEVLTETASQKRVYEVVAKPVVESVLEGYNGTIMAYGQTGTGKTFTLGRLGEEDTSYRGIMVRAMEDILVNISPDEDSITVSYLQLYMETLQDLLAPERDNIPIMEDPRTGDVSVPGATFVEIRDQSCFVDLLQRGEVNRFAANTKLNTESSRSHAILMVNVRKAIMTKRERDLHLIENGAGAHGAKALCVPMIRKGKLVVVDLAGSERIHKSGSEGHALEEAKSINLSLTALGKCVNALAEASSHVPTRDSKLTRLLRDSFGGTARTSLVITIGPSPRHRGETASTIMFGQRAMKVENMVKLKEEFDYKSLCRKLEAELDKLIAENERQAKLMVDSEEELERRLDEARACVCEAENKLANVLETMAVERLKHQKEHMEAVQKLDMERVERERMEKELSHRERNQVMQLEEELAGLVKEKLHDEISSLKLQLENERQLREHAEEQLRGAQYSEQKSSAGTVQRVEEGVKQKEKLEEEIKHLKDQLLQLSFEADETKKALYKSGSCRNSIVLDSPMNMQKLNQSNDGVNGQRATIARLFEQVGLQKILSLLDSEDLDVRVHAVKVVANLAAEESNQEKIVEVGGLNSLLMLLQSSEDETIRRVAAGAIANLAMNEINQELIVSQGGIDLLSRTADDALDPQTIRMVAGAIANLCGNDKLQVKLRDEGGIKALLRMVRCRHPDVLAQIARGIANFAKCESRGVAQGLRTGRSLLIDDGALPWIVANASNEGSPIRRHIELALCHLAQHEENAKDLVAGGALWELIRISRECSREDIQNLAHCTLRASPTFQSELRRLHMFQ